MIDVENLAKEYGRTRSLRGVSFRVEAGSVLGFLGPNGAGKTTTMRILAGLARPTAGRASVDGRDVAKDHEHVRRILGYLPEDAPGYPEMRADAYLRFMAEMKGIEPRRVAAEVDRVLEEIGMTAARKRLMGNMSKGMRQRIGLAQALLGDPKVVILDEPTNGLDPRQIDEVRRLIGAMRGRRTVILSTHILSNVQAACSHVAILNAGRLIASGPVDEIGRAGDSFRVRVRATGSREAFERALGAATPQGLETVRTEDGVHEAIAKAPRSNDPRPAMARALVAAGLELLEMREIEATLDEVFLKATSVVAEEDES